jgi:hypothetical protein
MQPRLLCENEMEDGMGVHASTNCEELLPYESKENKMTKWSESLAERPTQERRPRSVEYDPEWVVHGWRHQSDREEQGVAPQ